MSNTKSLTDAKNAKKDEFYTQFPVIQAEVNAYLEYNPDVFRDKTILLPCDDPDWSNFTKFFAQNFEAFGLKKLISTSYAIDSKPVQLCLFPSKVEEHSNLYDAKKTRSHGKLFVLEHDTNDNGRIDIADLQMTQYLEGDGDFRSDEVKKLRDEADIIITNPPFSLFREFMAWLLETDKKFLIIGSINAVTYKEIFPHIMENRIWLGPSISSGDREFAVPKDYPLEAAGYRIDEKGNHFIRVKGVRWFTNLDHGRRHQPLSLMTMEDNIKFSKHKEIKDLEYHKYINFNALEVPYTDAIPSNYNGVMGVPITFLDKFCPEQFEIIGQSLTLADMSVIKKRLGHQNGGPRLYIEVDGELVRLYDRILIRRKYDKDREKDILLIQNRIFRLFCERHQAKFTSAEMEDFFEKYGLWHLLRDCYDTFHIEGDEAIYCELMQVFKYNKVDLDKETEL